MRARKPKHEAKWNDGNKRLWLFAKVIKKMKWPNVKHNVFLYLIPEIAKSRYRLPVTFYCSKLFAWEAQNSAIKLWNLPNRQLLARTSSQSWDEFEKCIFNCGSEVNHIFITDNLAIKRFMILRCLSGKVFFAAQQTANEEDFFSFNSGIFPLRFTF